MVSWRIDPDVKIEAGTTDISSDYLTVTVHRPENAISRALISTNDFSGKNYIANVDIGEVIKISFRYGDDAWTQVFEGVTERVGPKLDNTQTLELTAFGYGRALRNTHCNANYGVESEDPSLDTPHEIWDDIIANYINRSLSLPGVPGVVTGYAILDTKVAPAANPIINFIEGGYKNNFTMINDVLTIYQGYRNGLAGMHWFVDENGALFINTIAAHENNASGWPTWWRTDQAGSTLIEGIDFLNSIFHKKTIGSFANKVVLYCNLRKPGTDIWCEAGGPAWGDDGLFAAPDYSAVQNIVGDESLRIQAANNPARGEAYYPSTEDAAWDIEKIGSAHTIPSINFYVWKDFDPPAIPNQLDIRLFTTDHDNDYFEILMVTLFASDPANEWVHHSIPIGPLWMTASETRQYRWAEQGAPDWADINGVAFSILSRPAENKAVVYIDDLHLSGKIIREAYDSTSITANDETQVILRYDRAVDDSLAAADDTGTAGNLAYGELLRREYIPTVGTFTTPLAVDALPGQLIRVLSDKYDSTNYRIEMDMRVKEIIHVFAPKPIGARTSWDVTSDVLNTFAVAFNEPHAAYHKAIHTDPDMKNLLTTGLDPYITRLSIDYP